ncbi:hypothetical protein LTR50_001574 [Elasticomyces elasticus]|nr:hypothetical protein LTR50_001574 [Elasticomyces elasticus]
MSSSQIPHPDPAEHARIQRESMSSQSSNSMPDRRRVLYSRQHKMRNKQHIPRNIEPAPPDQLSIQSQFLRSIAIALVAVGFDAVKPDALEALRAETEEYMLNFLSVVRTSMHSCRRHTPLPQDFALALSANSTNLSPTDPLTSSSLLPQTKLLVPPRIVQPRIPLPPEDELPPPSAQFEEILGPELSSKEAQAERRYIPSHFPPLPSKHTYVQTPVYAARERDPRKIRERAAQEGILAEQLLRKLQAASKTRAHSGRPVGKAHRPARSTGPLKRKRKEVDEEDVWSQTLAEMMKVDVELEDETDVEFGEDGRVATETRGRDTVLDEDMNVNYDRLGWRGGGPLTTLGV